MQVLCRLTEGLSDLWLYKSTDCGPDNTVHPQTSGQYALVEYESHHAAAMARRRLIPDRVQLWGREIIVEWATPHISMKVSSSPLKPLTHEIVIGTCYS